MSNNDTADKLRAKVEDWQSYLGKSESPWSSVPQPETPAAPVSPSPPQPSEPDSVYSPPAARPVAVAELESEPVIEVLPPEPLENEALPQSHTVVEVIPPEPTTRPYDMGTAKKRNGRRAFDEAELKGVLFSDPRKVESEFQHVRRANAVLSIFLIVMVGILCSVVAWHLVD